MPSQTSGLPPKAFDRRIAFSGEMPVAPFIRLFSIWRVTPSLRAAAVTESQGVRDNRGGGVRPDAGDSSSARARVVSFIGSYLPTHSPRALFSGRTGPF